MSGDDTLTDSLSASPKEAEPYAAKAAPTKDAGPIDHTGKYAGVASLTSLYSQLCGVLAGFAFTGLTVYLSASELPGHAAEVSVSLFTAFAALVITAILYALLSGESSSGATRRTDTSLLIYGLPFGLSIMTMFYSLTLIAVERHELTSMVAVGKLLVVVVTPSVILGRLNVAAMDQSNGGTGRKPHHFGLILLLIYPFVATYVLVKAPAASYIGSGAGTVPAYIGLGSAIITAALSPLISTRRPEFQLPRIWVYLFLALSFISLLTYSILAVAALK